MGIRLEKEIILAGISDINDLSLLLNQLFSQDIEFEPNYEKQVKGLKDILSNSDIGEILILKLNGKIIGMVSLLYSISTALGGKVAILEDMIIDKNYRKNGFGSDLINEAIKYAKNQNCLRITLLTDFNNEIAIDFYTKFGFKKSEMIPMRLVFNK